MWEGIIGVVVGGLISIVVTVANGFWEDKRFEKTLRQENINQQKSVLLKRLHYVLVPIIEIYTKSDTELENVNDSIYTTAGSGLLNKYMSKLEYLIDENKKYLSLDLIKEYHKVKTERVEVYSRDYDNQAIRKLEDNGEMIVDGLFDNDRSFIDKIESEAMRIEKLYYDS